jgi:hypothetical protein
MTIRGDDDYKTGILSRRYDYIDGRWHRVALVWDGSLRHLCVDSEKAANDLDQAKHMTRNPGLHIGVDSHLTEGVFFPALLTTCGSLIGWQNRKNGLIEILTPYSGAL